jgi:NADP-dependent 3-hydroxy acid dehydrogenase YdfG
MQKENKPVWFITGCSTGFGRELATLILSKGWNAVITARDANKIKDIAEGYEASALVLELDVTNKENIKTAVAKAQDTFGVTR